MVLSDNRVCIFCWSLKIKLAKVSSVIFLPGCPFHFLYTLPSYDLPLMLSWVQIAGLIRPTTESKVWIISPQNLIWWIAAAFISSLILIRTRETLMSHKPWPRLLQPCFLSCFRPVCTFPRVHFRKGISWTSSCS